MSVPLALVMKGKIKMLFSFSASLFCDIFMYNLQYINICVAISKVSFQFIKRG